MGIQGKRVQNIKAPRQNCRTVTRVEFWNIRDNGICWGEYEFYKIIENNSVCTDDYGNIA